MFEEQGKRRRRHGEESRARTRSQRTRSLIVALLHKRPLNSAEVRSALEGAPPLSVVNYHLSVLLSDGEVVREDGYYRPA